MPFCTKCGRGVKDADRFCRQCGAPQAPAPGRVGAAVGGVSPSGASILCYIPWLGWIASVIVLLSDRFRHVREVRFHAYQGLYLFATWLLIHWVVDKWLHIIGLRRLPVDDLLELGVLVVWVIMIVKTAKGERYSLPVLGDLAERSI